MPWLRELRDEGRVRASSFGIAVSTVYVNEVVMS